MKHSILKLVGALALLVAFTACKKDTLQKDTPEASGCPEGAVDLGIVMTREDGTTYKVYWATCNLCKDGFVSSPEVYGDYYAWGETEPKSDYDWSTYKFGTSESGPFSKYNPEDKKTVLETGPNGDDVASKLLGGKWRMPTYAEWTALLDNCTCLCLDNFCGTGVAGTLVMSNVEGYKGNSIFLPTAGYRSSNLCTDNIGYSWSSSLYTEIQENNSALIITFYSGGFYDAGSPRRFGRSVRPVTE